MAKVVFRSTVDLVRGYEYDSTNDCVWVRRSDDASQDYCRDAVNCQNACSGVNSIYVFEDPANLTEDIFLQNYANSGQPVVVKGLALKWTAVETFDFDYFRELYRELDSPVLLNSEPECQFFAWDFKEFKNMDEVFSMPVRRANMEKGSKPWYIGWANCDDEARDILREHYLRPYFLPNDSESGRRDWFFLGTPGYGAPMHIDNVRHPSWQAQISGYKIWGLKPPPECQWTCGTKELEVTLEPGDVIVVNTNWWFHSTRVIGEDLSVTVTNEYII